MFESFVVYIDDFNSIEKLDLRNAISHITTGRRKIKVKAMKSEILFTKVGELAKK